MKKLILTGVMSAVLPTLALADCPAITAEDMQGIGAGAYPNQFELAALQDAASCEMGFSENPSIAALNSQIRGNADLPPVADRLPDEPLVIVPFASIGEYGGTFNALSNATESGTSDFLVGSPYDIVPLFDRPGDNRPQCRQRLGPGTTISPSLP